MTPVFQTIMTAPGGNCFQACLATMLDLPLESVPHFSKDYDINEKMRPETWSEICHFVNSHGQRITWLNPESSDEEERSWCRVLLQSDFYYIALGKSPLGNWGHLVIMKGNVLIHDPNPNGSGLAGSAWLYLIIQPKNDSIVELLGESDVG